MPSTYTTRRLNDFKTQETYFNRIIERYMKLCALNREELDRLFASVSSAKASTTTTPTGLSTSFSALSLSKHAPPPTAASSTLSIPRNALTPSIDELATVLASLRKLREAITASHRCDTFARRAYFFAIHVAVLCKDWASYLPALHSLLEFIHTRAPLAPHDLKEYVGLLILDQACRQADVAKARETKLKYGYTDWRVEGVLRALVLDDYMSFWRLRRGVDGYQRAVMGFAEADVRLHALKCLGRGYMTVDRRYVERSTDRTWEELVQDGVGWELAEDGEKVVIRRPKQR